MQGVSPFAAAGQHKLVHRRLTTLRQVKQQYIRTRVPQAAAGNSPNTSSRLQQVIDGIDALNSKDPRQTTWQGKTLPYELAYSQWLTDWVLKLEPQPSEELRIVARGQHVERWRSPRSNYPEGKTGYFKWREDLKKAHASTVTDLMQQAGYDQDSQDRVTRIILKKDLKKDPENQIVEDGLCLVFLEHQFADLLEKEGADRMVEILRKTWSKMGEKGRAAALKLDLPADQADIVQRALQS